MVGNWEMVAAAINACRIQLRKCEEEFKYRDYENSSEDCSFEGAKLALGYLVADADIKLRVLIELNNLPVALSDYKKRFLSYKGKLAEVEHWDEDPEVIFSPSLRCISNTYDAVAEAVGPPPTSRASNINLLQEILRQTPHILNDRGIHPCKEGDIQRELFKFLRVVFPDMQREVPMGQIFKHYKADLGSAKLKTLIEIKFADSEAEFSKQVDEIYTDMKGYSGKLQWDTFIALFYTTAPIASEQRLIEQFKTVKVRSSWIPILVHGNGGRKPKS
ncbi:hypothetical protein [Cypionkella sp.]|uniref:PD-(D/E)XK nuclease domain-containing protein n=1 Tax=Cypionkella sp. TaxID=2811411 RepID=UPI002AB97097|nr:hypothetical protein [Cypionkella sp.]MDZ4393098.1 hypothetical protein [Cypionkella sp.]